MTGLYPHKAGMGWMTAVDEGVRPYQGQMRLDQPTVAEILRDAGYATYMSGMWHLTVDSNFAETPLDTPSNGSWPRDRGFDRYYGGLSGGGDHWRPTTLVDDDTRIDPDSLPEDYYYTHAINEHAVKFIEAHDASDPMFLYVAHYAPHLPMQAPDERIAKTRGRYRVGYDELMQARYERMQQMGITPQNAKPSKPHREPSTWKDLPEEEREEWIELMATYAAMIEIVDDGIGQIVDSLEKKAMLDNTVILFLSDNGATDEGPPLKLLAANLSNYPYINYKMRTHNGSIASPLIISRPGGLDAFAGELRHSVSHIADLTPTMLEMAGVSFPSEYKANTHDEPQGLSLVPTFTGGEIPDRLLYWEHEKNLALREGDWKAVFERDQGEWELYDLYNDPFEQNDLSSEHRDMLIRLVNLFHEMAAEDQVFPLHHEGWHPRIEKYTFLNPEQSGNHPLAK
jgi:arylsulfatase